MKKILLTIFLTVLIFLGGNKVHAGEQGCTALFNYSIDHSVSSFTYLFSDQSSSLNPIISWDWNFGDSSISSFQNPEHQYLKAGVYAVSLRVTCNDGSFDVFTDTIKVVEVIPPTCTSYFTFSPDSVSPMIIHFTDHSIATGDTVISWLWNFGDLSTGSTSQHPTHQFSNVGTYSVCLTINTSGGCSSIYYDSITISTGIPSCHASFTYKADSVSGNPNAIFFYDNSSASDPIISWKWHFGDGDSAYSQNPAHIYPHAGVYEVSLIIKTQNGCTSDIKYPIQVGNPQSYNMWGRVYLGIQTTDKCIAYLYKVFNNGYTIPVDTVKLTSVNDTLGVYYFYQILEGNHKVKVLLPENSDYDELYAPTYYTDNLFWKSSSTLSLFQDISLANVQMKPVSQNLGTGKVSGKVYRKGTTDPIKGVQVLLLGPSNQVNGYTFSDNLGEYSFDDVPTGAFSVYAEVTGLYSFPLQINIQPYDTLDNVNITLNNTQAVTYIEEKEIEEETLVFNIYPNPVSNILHIDFEKPTSSVYYYQVFNNIGQLVFDGKISQFSEAKSLDMTSLKSGLYYIQVNAESGKSNVTMKFIKQ